MADHVALVTGASRGIGRATALELARCGASVVVNFERSEAQADEVVNEITASGGRAIAVQADVSDEAQVQRLVAATIAEFEQIDVLVCNAGVIRDQLAAMMTWEQWDTVVRVNLGGTFLCVREVLREMMRRRSGSIVLLSSVAATRGSRGHVNYAAAKGGINSMVRALAVELASRKIRVNGVSPGVIETDMSATVRDLAPDEILSQIPLGRFGTVEEVAKAIRYLASPDASYITGEVLQVTGGLGA